MKKSIVIALSVLVVGVICCIAALCIGIGEIESGIVALPRAVRYQEEPEDKALMLSGGIDQLELDVDNADCTITVGTQASLTGGRDVTWKVEGNVLKVKQEQKGWWWKSKPAPITLTIPEGISVMDIDVDAGIVQVSNMAVTQDLRCEVDAGMVTLQDVTVGRRLEADVDAGAVEYTGKLYGEARLDCDAGAIDLVLQGGSTIGRVTGNVDAGEMKAYVDGKKVLDSGFAETVSTDLPGAVGSELLTFDCDAGSISVDLTTKEIQKDTMDTEAAS